MKPQPNRYLTTALPQASTHDLRVWLNERPTLGVFVPEEVAAACSLGTISNDSRGDALQAVQHLPLPANGTRIVLGSTLLTSVLAAACLEHRARPSMKGAAARLASLRRSLERSEHLCRALLGTDPTSLHDTDLALLHATLCRIAHHDRLPLRFRLDAVCQYVQAGTFTGLRSHRLHTRRWLEHTYRSHSTARAARGNPAERRALEPPASPEARGTEPAPTRGRDRGGRRPCLVRVKPDVIRRQVAADASLYGSWERVRNNARARGTWNRDLARFEARLGAEIARLSRALTDGTWRPGKAHHVTLDKPAGGTRHLHVPPVGDRVVERAISQVVSRLVDEHLSPWSFAFRPGRGVNDAVHELAALRDEGGSHVARFDLASCFDSVDHRRLREALLRYLDDAWLLEVVDAILSRELPGLPKDQPLVGIAQGSPLSPLLCNLVLDELDRGLFRCGYPAVRYADLCRHPHRSA